MTVPCIFSAHHASANFGQWSDRVALTAEQRTRYSDIGTNKTVPRTGALTMIGTHSRGVVDLNRPPDSASLFPVIDFAKPTPNHIWLPGEAPETDRKAILDTIYYPYHAAITDKINSAQNDIYVIAIDNTAPYEIGKNKNGEAQTMLPIILSNNGDEGTTSGASITCDPKLLRTFGTLLQQSLREAGLPNEVYFNVVYTGGYITQRYTNYTQPNLFKNPKSVQSFQIEYDYSITHNARSLIEHPGSTSRLRKCFETSFYKLFLK